MGSCSSLASQRLWKEQLGLRAGVVEDQRGAVLLDLASSTAGIAYLPPAAGPGRRLLGRQHRDVGVGAGIGLQDVARVGVAGEEAGDGLGVLDRGRQPDAPQAGRKRREPRERQHQLIAPLAFGQRVDLVDDDPLEPREGAPASS
jgi:hypothetical protein